MARVKVHISLDRAVECGRDIHDVAHHDCGMLCRFLATRQRHDLRARLIVVCGTDEDNIFA
ncbi:MAG TPA: hypothetical protein K8V34_07320 [Corynebacterium phoceense]|nr:hypothetical protein [Corynebacterium phoceense]HJG43820.1 hypothetical protein [Corynebacterium phoceense]